MDYKSSYSYNSIIGQVIAIISIVIITSLIALSIIVGNYYMITLLPIVFIGAYFIIILNKSLDKYSLRLNSLIINNHIHIIENIMIFTNVFFQQKFVERKNINIPNFPYETFSYTYEKTKNTIFILNIKKENTELIVLCPRKRKQFIKDMKIICRPKSFLEIQEKITMMDLIDYVDHNKNSN